VKNIASIAQVTVDREMTRLLDEGRNAALILAEGLVGSKSEEVASSNVKRARDLVVKDLTHGAALAAGYVWKKYGG
jgi:hypothetical protein